ncbi:unnamed protein product [Brassica oleracea]
MSTNKSVSLLKAIKPYKQGWRIQVKLVHSWRQKTIYGGDSLELIFADETGDKIHCTCKRTYIQRTPRDLRLGEWHMIDVFRCLMQRDSIVQRIIHTRCPSLRT